MIMIEFKQAFAKFLKNKKYMQEKRLRVDPDSDQWKQLCKRFDSQISEPMDDLWSSLSLEQKKSF